LSRSAYLKAFGENKFTFNSIYLSTSLNSFIGCNVDEFSYIDENVKYLRIYAGTEETVSLSYVSSILLGKLITA
jgi:hypothetical protein